ncbi:MAG: archaellin/type IV pilin N-terminal domain-containing protein, partial [Candidatus Bathyarchaeia archaeon]
MNFRKFRKSAKALSPVIATIILIAVTVAVSVVVAAWMGALTIGFMGNSEQAKITNVVLSDPTGTSGQA